MPRLSGKHAVYGVLLLASVAFLLYSMQTAKNRPDAADGISAGRTGGAGGQEVAAAIPTAVSDDVDFSRYEDLARTNVFSDRRTSAPPTPKTQARPPQSLPDFSDVKPSPPKDPPVTTKQADFAGWTYAGYIIVNGEKRGLLQNDSSDTGRDFAVGEKFLGATVEEVTGRTIRLRSGRSVTTLSIPELFPIVPLDKSASATPERQRPRPR